jgi:phage/plasmid-like protein (TIGR03299 family)
MSQETIEWLNQNTLIGHTEKRGNAWHYRASAQGDEPNHYEGPVPVADVERRLFHWTAQEVPILHQVPCDLDVEGGISGIDDNGNMYQVRAIPGRKAIRRSDTNEILGIFKDGYQPHQPKEWLIENVQMLVGGTLDIGSAGLLRGGAIAWLQVEAEENVVTPSGVEFRPFITAATSFDGSLSTTYKVGSTVIVCDNTMFANLAEAGETVKVRHTRYGTLNVNTIRDTLGIVEQAADAFTASVEKLTNWTITDREWKRFLDEICVFNVDSKSTRGKTIADKKRAELTTLWTNDNRVTPWAGTAFGVVQATNTWAHHVQIVRGGNRGERNALNAITDVTAKDDAHTLDILTRVCVGA